MNKQIITMALAAMVAVPMFAKDKKSDPVLLKMAGTEVPLSEFKYLYEKNNSQQQQPLTPEEYLDMFIAYRRKVAAAHDAGVDTTAAFRKEYKGYRDELFRPYLENDAERERLINETYENMKREVRASHIMIAKGRTPQERAAAQALADSVLTLVKGGADFEELARRYSIDRSVVKNNGDMGYFSVGRFPYQFEKAAFESAPGIVPQVVETDYGFHVMKVTGERPYQGEVLTQHILKLTQGKPEEAKPAIKATIDSIRALLLAGADFSDMARRESEDPGSAREGGMLPWFSHGMMVLPFEEASFALPDSAISDVVETAYGYHIIKKLGSRGVMPYDEARPKIIQMMARDERGNLPRKAKFDQLRKAFGAEILDANVASVKETISKHGSLDSMMLAIYTTYPVPLAKAGGRTYSTSEMFEPLKKLPQVPASSVSDFIDANVESGIDAMVADLEMVRLEATDAEFRNLLREYHDGMLLFEISNRKVWDAAARDTEGLKEFFESHKADYKWDAPKYKGVTVYAKNDSIAKAARAICDKRADVSLDSLNRELRATFGPDVRMEKVLVRQGENNRVDAEVWGAERPVGSGRWPEWFFIRGHVIDAPEEVADVRGIVVTDYQAELESRWLKELADKYPVKVNKKVLKKLR